MDFINQYSTIIPNSNSNILSYYKSQANKSSKIENEMESDNESISDTEFDEFLSKTENDGIDPKDDLDWDLDFAE